MANNTNPFARYAYSNFELLASNNGFNSIDVTALNEYSNVRKVVTGGDIAVYINNIPVFNVEQVTYSISTETIGQYAIGNRNAIAYPTGKRVVVGNLVFSQFGEDPILEGVFRLSQQGIGTTGQMWDKYSSLYTGTATQPVAYRLGYANTRVAVNPVNTAGVPTTTQTNIGMPGFAGVDANTFRNQVADQIAAASRLRGSEKIAYPDQIPPFNVTMIGVSKNGDVCRAGIFGVQLTQMTGGISANDMGTTVGYAFVALAFDPWKLVREETNGGASINVAL